MNSVLEFKGISKYFPGVKAFGKLINESLEKSEKEMREILAKTTMADFNFKE